MKKKLFTLLAVVLVFVFAVPVFGKVKYEFTKSAEKEIKIVPFEGGEIYIVYDKDGNIIPEESKIILKLTTYRDRNKVTPVAIKDLLEKSKKDLDERDNLGQLTDELGKELQALKDKTSDPLVKDLTFEDFYVVELFNLSLVENDAIIKTIEDLNGIKLECQIDTDLKPEDIIFLLTEKDGKWNVLKTYTLDGTGLMKISLEELCNIAIIAENKTPGEDDPGKSPQTGYDSTGYIVTGSLIAILAATIGCCIIADKKRA